MKEGLKFPNLREHLKEGVKPIMVCVGTRRDFTLIKPDLSWEETFPDPYASVSGPDISHNVDYEGWPEVLDRKNFLNGGYATYVLSVVDGKDKFSNGFFDCTGLIVTGVDKKTGKNISFLSHQDPKKFLDDKKEKFISDLQKRFFEIKDRCVPGTIDAVIVGGNYLFYKPNEEEQASRISYRKMLSKQNYLDTIKLLTTETEQALGFKPRIENGPKTAKRADNIYFDNENRRLYLMRPKVNQDTGSFTQSDIEEEKKKWEEGKDSSGV